jgi:hypothetical protein
MSPLEMLKKINAMAEFNSWCGIEVTVAEAGFVEIQMPWRPEVGQYSGFLHAGLIGTLIDTACGFAAGALEGTQQQPDAPGWSRRTWWCSGRSSGRRCCTAQRCRPQLTRACRWCRRCWLTARRSGPGSASPAGGKTTARRVSVHTRAMGHLDRRIAPNRVGKLPRARAFQKVPPLVEE